MKNVTKGCQIPHSRFCSELTDFPRFFIVPYILHFSNFTVVEVYLVIVMCRTQLHRFPYKGFFNFPEICPFFFPRRKEFEDCTLERCGLCTFINEISVWQMFREPDTCRARKASDLPCRCSKVDLSIHNKSELSWKNHICCLCTKPCVNSYFWPRNPRRFYFLSRTMWKFMLDSGLRMNRIR